MLCPVRNNTVFLGKHLAVKWKKDDSLEAFIGRIRDKLSSVAAPEQVTAAPETDEDRVQPRRSARTAVRRFESRVTTIGPESAEISK